MGIRTDLVSERQKLHTAAVEGAVTSECKIKNVKIKTVCIETVEAAEKLEKPCGKYITIEYSDIISPSSEVAIRQAIIRSLYELMPKISRILVVGLGNRDITPDAIGPLTADHLFVTRHIGSELREQLCLKNINSISALVPGVLGKTGIEAIEIIKGAVMRTTPEAIIVIDALAACSTERLCRTIQLSDTGICPGSGVENARKEISEAVLGIPVIAVGIPTVVDIRNLINDAADKICSNGKMMMVTPTDIDIQVRRSSEVLARSLNLFLHPSLDEEQLKSFV